MSGLEFKDDELDDLLPIEEVQLIKKRGRGRPKLTDEEREARAQARESKEIIRDPEILCIRINLSNSNISSDLALYERVRGAWRAFERAFACKYVFAVITGKFNGISTNKIIAIYDVIHWQSFDISGYTTRNPSDFASVKDRVEFIGEPTKNEEFQKLVGKIFKTTHKLNGSNPISFKPLAGVMDMIRDIPEQ